MGSCLVHDRDRMALYSCLVHEHNRMAMDMYGLSVSRNINATIVLELVILEKADLFQPATHEIFCVCLPIDANGDLRNSLR